jgi:formate-dependent nitrite reductase membrane component NrfD
MSGREASMVPDATPSSYYGRPVLKEPVWRWPIPSYLYTGGVAAGSALLTFGAVLTGDASLARRARFVSLGAVAASGALLVHDLGKPSRFVNMLRVMKPTSPMSVGTWLLSTFGAAAGIASAAEVHGGTPRVRMAADAVGAVTAPALATYTAVLLADTAVPVWHEARRELPLVFASGAAASAGAIAAMLQPLGGSDAPRRMAISGAVAEMVSAKRMEQALGELAEPYHEGRAGWLKQAATGLSAAGILVLSVAGRRRRSASVIGGALVATGAAAERFAVMEAGRQSARDPKYVVGPQRRRVDAGGTASVSSQATTPSGPGAAIAATAAHLDPHVVGYLDPRGVPPPAAGDEASDPAGHHARHDAGGAAPQ